MYNTSARASCPGRRAATRPRGTRSRRADPFPRDHQRSVTAEDRSAVDAHRVRSRSRGKRNHSSEKRTRPRGEEATRSSRGTRGDGLDGIGFRRRGTGACRTIPVQQHPARRRHERSAPDRERKAAS